MAENQSTPLDVEIWKPVIGWEGYYEVSNHGRVRSLDRVIVTKGGIRKRRKGQNLSPLELPHGYLAVNIRGNRYIHRLVLESFDRPALPGEECRHLDGNRQNNKSNNLAWGTSSDNNYDIVQHGKHWQVEKEFCPRGHSLMARNLVPSNAKKLRDANGRECLACSRAKSIIRNHPEENYDLASLSDLKFEEIMADARVGRTVRANRTKTHCPRGHVLEMPNLVRKRFEEKGYRDCLACNRAGNAARSRGIKSEQFRQDLADSKYKEIMGT